MNKLFLLFIFSVFAIINFSSCILSSDADCQPYETFSSGECITNANVIQSLNYRMYWQLRLENIETKLDANTRINDQIIINMVPDSSEINYGYLCPEGPNLFNYRVIATNKNKEEIIINKYNYPKYIAGPIHLIIEADIFASSRKVDWSRGNPLTKAQVLGAFSQRYDGSTDSKMFFDLIINKKKYDGVQDNIFYYEVASSRVHGQARLGKNALADKAINVNYGRYNTNSGCISYPLTDKEYVFDMSSISK